MQIEDRQRFLMFEDINRDTMNTINAYYEYSIDVKPNPIIGQNYITDIRNTQ
jgi:cell surface protein SprA